MPQLQWLDDEQLIHDRMLEELEKRMQNMLNQLRGIDGGLALLNFLYANANTLMTIEDIAYFLKQPHTVVERNLYTLVDLGLARWTNVVGLTFFGLTADPERRQLVRDLFDWQKRWQARLARIESVIEGKAQPSPNLAQIDGMLENNLHPQPNLTPRI